MDCAACACETGLDRGPRITCIGTGKRRVEANRRAADVSGVVAAVIGHDSEPDVPDVGLTEIEVLVPLDLNSGPCRSM